MAVTSTVLHHSVGVSKSLGTVAAIELSATEFVALKGQWLRLFLAYHLRTAYPNRKAPESRQFGGFYQAGNATTDP